MQLYYTAFASPSQHGFLVIFLDQSLKKQEKKEP